MGKSGKRDNNTHTHTPLYPEKRDKMSKLVMWKVCENGCIAEEEATGKGD